MKGRIYTTKENGAVIYRLIILAVERREKQQTQFIRV
jgi:hypothetical protein